MAPRWIGLSWLGLTSGLWRTTPHTRTAPAPTSRPKRFRPRNGGSRAPLGFGLLDRSGGVGAGRVIYRDRVEVVAYMPALSDLRRVLHLVDVRAGLVRNGIARRDGGFGFIGRDAVELRLLTLLLTA